MTITKKGLEKDVEKLSKLFSHSLKSSQFVLNKIGNYLEGEVTLGELLDISKPLLKRQKLEVEILALKAQLEIVRRMIDFKRKRQNKKNSEEAETKKGD
jgi:hypothetical protein